MAEEEKVVAEEEKVVAEEEKVVAEEEKVVAEEEKVVAEEEKVVAEEEANILKAFIDDKSKRKSLFRGIKLEVRYSENKESALLNALNYALAAIDPNPQTALNEKEFDKEKFEEALVSISENPKALASLKDCIDKGDFVVALNAERKMEKREKVYPSTSPKKPKAERVQDRLAELLLRQEIVGVDGELPKISMENFDGGKDDISLPIPKIGENGKEYAERLNTKVDNAKNPSFYSGMSADFNYIYEGGKLVGMRVVDRSALDNGFAKKYGVQEVRFGKDFPLEDRTKKGILNAVRNLEVKNLELTDSGKNVINPDKADLANLRKNPDLRIGGIVCKSEDLRRALIQVQASKSRGEDDSAFL
ncbi:MAG: hypothetical protein ACJAZX_001440 [Rickettsiales bacterium]